LINDSTNVGFYGLGRQEAPSISYVARITGTSNNIILAPLLQDQSNRSYDGTDMVREDLDGDSTYTIEWPTGCSIYRRGTPDDAAATI